MDGERGGGSRGRRALKRALLGLAAFVLLSLAVTPLALRLIFPRWEGDGAALPEAARPVDIPSGGVTLRGWLLEPPEPAGVALLLHGMRGNAGDMAGAMEALYALGWTALAPELTGTGASGGVWCRGLQQALPDGRAALEWIGSRVEWAGLPVVVLGHSAGGWAAAMLAGDPRVDGVVCLSAFDRPVELMTAWAGRYAGPLAWVETPFLALWEALLFGGDADASAARALTAAGKPALVVHGTEDALVPGELSLCARLPDSAPGVTLLLLEGAGHSGLLPEHTAPLREALAVLTAAAS